MPRPRSTSIRLYDEERKILAALIEDYGGGISQSDVVRIALNELAKSRGLKR